MISDYDYVLRSVLLLHVSWQCETSRRIGLGTPTKSNVLWCSWGVIWRKENVTEENFSSGRVLKP